MKILPSLINKTKWDKDKDNSIKMTKEKRKLKNN